MKKCIILLCLYDDLQSGKEISINATCKKYSISVPTFRRYIAALREFYEDRYFMQIVYDSKKCSYSLKKELLY